MSLEIRSAQPCTYEWADTISDAFGEDGVGQLVVR